MTVDISSTGMLWYRAPLPTGELRLGLPDIAPASPAVPPLLRAAMRLADAEGLVGALETWTGEALDLRPLDEETVGNAAGVAFEIVGDTPAAPRGSRCLLPLRAVARRAVVPPLLRSEACAWQRVDLDVELDVFDLPEAQQAALSPGRMLLLPGTFDAAWRVHLCHAGLSLRLPARWTAQRTLAPEPGVAAPRAGAWRARLQRRATLNPATLLGIGGPPAAEFDAAPEADWQAVLEATGDARALRGELMPAFGGQALRLH